MPTILSLKNITLYYFLLLSVISISCKENNKKLEKGAVISPENTEKDSVAEINFVEEKTTKDFVLGKFNYKKDTSYIKIKKVHSSKTIYLKKVVYTAFVEMYNEARKSNITLKVISGTRNFYEQKAIWERKWLKYENLDPFLKVKKILEYSSMPSTSRHHWGTDIDINNLNNSYFEKGVGKKEYNWLLKNANKYGFYQVYTSKKDGRDGYNLERWHWSYIPLANKYLKFYNKNISYEDIKGFNGYEYSKKIEVIESYVNGISPKIKKIIK